MIKNAEDAGITVNFYDSNIGRSAGSATTSTYKLENVEAKDVTIERPAVEITSNNADFEKVMDPTLAVRYVSASSALADGFTSVSYTHLYYRKWSGRTICCYICCQGWIISYCYRERIYGNRTDS